MNQEENNKKLAIVKSPSKPSIHTRIKPKKPIATGKLTIAPGIEIPCAVLEDGTRLLTQRGVSVSLGRYKNPHKGQASMDDRPAFLSAKNLEPFIPDKLRQLWSPIPFESVGGYKGNIAFGYNALILPLVCGVFLDADEKGALHKSQKPIARRAQILTRAFATVGIIALVDEATGYQYIRDRDALTLILQAYILDEYLPWTKRFPDEFYKELFRLRGWQYSPPKVAKTQLVGKITNDIVYKRLPKGVLEELRRKNPVTKEGYRGHKHHQFLTEDIGNPHLEKHLAVVTALMRASTSWDKFKRLLQRAVPIPGEQLYMPEPDDESVT